MTGWHSRVLATVTATVVATGFGGFTAVSAHAAAESSAELICPYYVRTYSTPRYISAYGSSYNGVFGTGSYLKAYEGSNTNGRMKTTTNYWVIAANISRLTGPCEAG